MGVPHEEILAKFTPEARARIEAHKQELIREYKTLCELRQAMGYTQAQVGKLLGKPQSAISKMEKQSDMLLSTLDEVAHALGGRARIVIEIPGHDPVYLSGIGDLAAP